MIIRYLNVQLLGTYKEDRMNTAICAAISKRAIVEFTYHSGTRMVELYVHGTSTAGNEVLRGYQTGGTNQPGKPVA